MIHIISCLEKIREFFYKVQWSGEVYIRKEEGLAQSEAPEATFWSTPVLTPLLLQDVKHARLHSDRLLS